MFMTTKEVSEKLNIPYMKLRQLINENKLRPTNPHSHFKFCQKDIDEFLETLENEKNATRRFEINKRFLKRAN